MIVGDSNMSETTTMLKVGTVDLILRMIEAGVIMRDLRMETLPLDQGYTTLPSHPALAKKH